MEFKRSYAVGLLALVYLMILYGMYNSLMVFGPIESRSEPMQELYRNVFLHVPINAGTYTAFTVTLIFSIIYLRSRNLKWDTIAASSAKLGLIFCSLTLLTGMAWAKPAWGSYWNWDPRETTTLILWFIFAAYFALRSSIVEDEARARLSAILGIFGYAGIPLTYISTTMWFSLHPRLKEFSLTSGMKPTLMVMIFGVLLLYGYLLWLEVKVGELEIRERHERRH
jgi:heme exporter protein C